MTNSAANNAVNRTPNATDTDVAPVVVEGVVAVLSVVVVVGVVVLAVDVLVGVPAEAQCTKKAQRATTTMMFVYFILISDGGSAVHTLGVLPHVDRPTV